MSPPDPRIRDVLIALQDRLDRLPPGQVRRRTFIETYSRTTEAVARAVDGGAFEDPDWVRTWDVVFAGYFLAAHDADLAGATVPRPWRLAFATPQDHHLLIHLLLGMNAHINYDLPQAMLEVITPEDFDDPARVAQRRRDHERIDRVLAGRVAAEDTEIGGARRMQDRLLTPINRWSSRRFLREARRCVWHNVIALHTARTTGPEAYAARMAELEVLVSAKIIQLQAPGQTLLRLALVGFGVRLPPV